MFDVWKHLLEMHGWIGSVQILSRSRSISISRVASSIFFLFPSIAIFFNVKLFVILLRSHGSSNHDFWYVPTDRKSKAWGGITTWSKIISYEKSKSFFVNNNGKKQTSNWTIKVTTSHDIAITWQMHQVREWRKDKQPRIQKVLKRYLHLMVCTTPLASHSNCNGKA